MKYYPIRAIPLKELQIRFPTRGTCRSRQFRLHYGRVERLSTGVKRYSRLFIVSYGRNSKFHPFSIKSVVNIFRNISYLLPIPVCKLGNLITDVQLKYLFSKNSTITINTKRKLKIVYKASRKGAGIFHGVEH